uniref:Uncharacterized protein n=1 Tax=Anopheles merus TaxID=30066 RepID=A0A182USJ2_ANOME
MTTVNSVDIHRLGMWPPAVSSSVGTCDLCTPGQVDGFLYRAFGQSARTKPNVDVEEDLLWPVVVCSRLLGNVVFTSVSLATFAYSDIVQRCDHSTMDKLFNLKKF